MIPNKKRLISLEAVLYIQLQAPGLKPTALLTPIHSNSCRWWLCAGASKVCSTDADSVHIGDMSRDWKSSEASVGEDGYTFSCLSSDITVTQLVVAIDGLSVVVKKGGAADQCISAMGGLSMAQLRWIFSDWSETDLANHEKGGLNMNSTTPSNDDDGIREWSDLDDSAACPDNEIKLGVPILILEPTNTSESRYSVRSVLLTVNQLQKDLIPLGAIKTLRMTTKSLTELTATRTLLVTSAMHTTKKTLTH